VAWDELASRQSFNDIRQSTTNSHSYHFVTQEAGSCTRDLVTTTGIGAAFRLMVDTIADGTGANPDLHGSGEVGIIPSLKIVHGYGRPLNNLITLCCGYPGPIDHATGPSGVAYQVPDFMTGDGRSYWTVDTDMGSIAEAMLDPANAEPIIVVASMCGFWAMLISPWLWVPCAIIMALTSAVYEYLPWDFSSLLDETDKVSDPPGEMACHAMVNYVCALGHLVDSNSPQICPAYECPQFTGYSNPTGYG